MRGAATIGCVSECMSEQLARRAAQTCIQLCIRSARRRAFRDSRTACVTTTWRPTHGTRRLRHARINGMRCRMPFD
eukprot:4417262-Lingulodinium_polyedra.AAC.1